MAEPILELKNITKSFGSVLAVDGVSFQVGWGEIVGLVGDNGAGKSTIIRMIAGVYTPDSGEIVVRGKRMSQWDVKTARACGIETVYQDRALVEQQTIIRNIFMGRELTTFGGFINLRKQRAEADKLMRNMGFTSKVFSSDSVVNRLSGGERQGVAIARALYFKADLVLLDEPTTALSLTESEKVFGFARRIKADGRSVVFISHNIYHTYDLADRFIILDRGQVVLQADKTEMRSAEELVRALQVVAREGREGLDEHRAGGGSGGEFDAIGPEVQP
jgi:simple sugar transport system ATP-binding protein